MINPRAAFSGKILIWGIINDARVACDDIHTIKIHVGEATSVLLFFFLFSNHLHSA